MKTNFSKFKFIFSAIPVVLILFILTSTAIPQNRINNNVSDGDENGNRITSSEYPVTENFQKRTMTGVNAGGYFGYSVKAAGDVNADGYDDFIIGAMHSDEAGTNAGKAYIYFGGINFDTIPDVILYGDSPGILFGYSVSTAGDVNRDGFSDVIISALSYQSDAGIVYIFYGGTVMDTTPDVILSAEAIGDFFGVSLSDAGDVNADGYADVIIGASQSGNDQGRAYIFYGGSTMNNTADVIMTGEDDYDKFGQAVSGAGDVNGDGYADAMVGALFSDFSGKVFLFYGGKNMNNTADLIMTGGAFDDQFGSTLSDAGDVNGDGYSDIIAGMNGFYNYRDFAYVFFGGSNMDNVADITLSEPGSLLFGFRVSSAGDLNGDGYGDVMVAAWIYDTFSKVYIYNGGLNMNNVYDMVLSGEGTNDRFGLALSSAGDVNDDGFSDLIIGAYEYNNYTGKAFLYTLGNIVRLNIKIIPEGYYFSSTGTLNMSDTVRAYLHVSTSPYLIIDSSSAVINPVSFTGSFKFFNAPDGIYYIVIKHRNVIETWSKSGGEIFISGSTMNYDFTSIQSQAYGNNLKMVDSSPVRFAVYSGDVNQNGTIDIIDILLIHIDALSYSSGYISTDINGDGNTDLSDLLTAFNNSNNYISIVKP
ncbi:MAG: FG-GAP repeat protein [Ignavibacteria bacterium]|nr:FG-GAP repeat protein [Ignavibacteria bacterium]